MADQVLAGNSLPVHVTNTTLTLDADTEVTLSRVNKTVYSILYPTLDIGGAYATGNLMGNALLSIPNILIDGKSATLMSIVVLDKAKQNMALDVVLFSTTLPNTILTNRAAFDPTDSDVFACLGSVSISPLDYSIFSNNSVATVRGIGLVIPNTTGLLYAVPVARGAGTFGSIADLSIILTFWQD